MFAASVGEAMAAKALDVLAEDMLMQAKNAPPSSPPSSQTIAGWLGSVTQDTIVSAIKVGIGPISDIAHMEFAFIQSLGMSSAANSDLERLVSFMLDRGGVVAGLSAAIVQSARAMVVNGSWSSLRFKHVEDTFEYSSTEFYSLQLNLNLTSCTIEELLYKRKKVVQEVCRNLPHKGDLEPKQSATVVLEEEVARMPTAHATSANIQDVVLAPERIGRLVLAEESFRKASQEASAETRKAAQLAERLGSEHAEEREVACAALAELGEAAIAQLPAIFDRLRDAAWAVRRSAQVALQRLSESAPLATALVHCCNSDVLMDEPDAFVRQVVCEVLGKICQVASPLSGAIAKCLGDEDRDVRQAACEAIGRFGEAALQYKSRVRDLLHDEDKTTVVVAHKVLVQLGEAAEPHMEALLKSMRDESFFVRSATCKVVSDFKQATPRLLDALAAKLGDDDFFVRSAACEALSHHGEAVAKHLSALARAFVDDNVFVRRAACEAFGNLGEVGSQHSHALAERLKDEADWVRGAACEALGQLGQVAKPFSSQIAVLLNDPEEAMRSKGSRFPIRAAAAATLSQLGEVAMQYVPAIEQLLDDEDAIVSAIACRALLRILGPEAMDTQRIQESGKAQVLTKVRFQEPAGKVEEPLLKEAALGSEARKRITSMFKGGGGGGAPRKKKTDGGKQSQQTASGSPDDRLETSVANPPPTSQSKGRNLKVHVVAARDLRNADIGKNNLSDPFCVVSLAGKGSGAFKTGVERDTLEPVWNFEGLLQDVVVQDVIEFMVFDKDMFKKDDLLGQATLIVPEKPMNFNDDLQLEFQGAPAGRLRVKVREATIAMPPRAVRLAQKGEVDGDCDDTPESSGDEGGFDVCKEQTMAVRRDKKTNLAGEAITAGPPSNVRIPNAIGKADQEQSDLAKLDKEMSSPVVNEKTVPVERRRTPNVADEAVLAVPPGKGRSPRDAKAGGAVGGTALAKARMRRKTQEGATDVVPAGQQEKHRLKPMKTVDSFAAKDIDPSSKAISAMPAARLAQGLDRDAPRLRKGLTTELADGKEKARRTTKKRTTTKTVTADVDFEKRRSMVERFPQQCKAPHDQISLLLPLLQSEDVDIRGAAVEALARFGKAAANHHEAVSKLLSDITRFARSDGTDDKIQIVAMRALGEFQQVSDADRATLATIASGTDADSANVARHMLEQLGGTCEADVQLRYDEPDYPSATPSDILALNRRSVAMMKQENAEVRVTHYIDGKLGIRLKKNSLLITGFEMPEVQEFGWIIGDTITSINGQHITSIEEFRKLLAETKCELPLTFGVARDQSEVCVEETLGRLTSTLTVA